MTHAGKLSPLVGESVSEADERGKCEQKRKECKSLSCPRIRGKCQQS